MRSAHIFVAATAFALAAPSGCVDVEALKQQQRRQTQTVPPRKTFEIVEIDPETLPKAERVLPPLDGDHLILAIPDGWSVPPNSSKWICRFQFDRDSAYPSIIVTGGESTETGPDDKPLKKLDRAKVEWYVKRRQRELTDELKESGGSLAGDVEAVKIGNMYYIEYARNAKAGDKAIVRHIVEVVSHGRKYAFELRAFPGTIAQFRPYLHAAVRGTKIF